MYRFDPVFAALCAAMVAPLFHSAETAAGDRVVITATRSEQPLRDQAGNTATVSAEDIELTSHTHVSELLSRTPGTWITRGSSQEHLTAIRSPILTGPGACGAFLFLEDGLPVRPAGFCNANQLIELDTEQARSLEVIRGPSSALYGSNALHGLINVISAGPADAPARFSGLDLGPNDFWRLRGTTADGVWRLTGLHTRDGGWRDGSSYSQGKVNIRHDGDTLGFAFAGSWLEQDVAAFIIGQNSYRNRAIARSNPSPDAYRDMDSQRASVSWRPRLEGWQLNLRPYVRRSRMDFLQHFIPGQPMEVNGHESIGLQFAAERLHDSGLRWILGSDLEYADIFVRQTQLAPLTNASPFLNETRPQGQHYDFRVAAVTTALFVHAELPVDAHWRFSGGLRVERTRYDYENRMSTGNLREDGTACGMGGCLYNRPADRSDSFTVLTPKLGLVRKLGQNAETYVSVTRGHRAPQVNELYRLQRGQDVADLDSERMDAFELGVRGFVGTLQVDAALFAMRKRDIVFQDSNGFSVSDGRTRHRGLELSAIQPLGSRFEVALSGTLARHTYDFDRVIAGGDTIVQGAEVDTAPRHLASARLVWSLESAHRVELEALRVGAHWLDAANQARYHGHTLVNLRASHRVVDRWRLGWRITNLADRAYAERADFAFNDYRYFPGPGRSFFVTVGLDL